MPQTDLYAVFGSPIKHSKSPFIHRQFAQQTQQNIDYHAQLVDAENFDTAVENFFQQGGKGLNCTVPLKELAWQRADQLSARAEMSKAVNTLVLQRDGSLLGDNTDGIGLVTDLTQNHAIPLAGKKLLILGAGGATRGILLPLQSKNVLDITIANRTVNKALNLADEFKSNGKITGCGFDDLQNQQFDLILNATSASLSNQLPPLPENILKPGAVCYDLAYANEDTPFVQWGKQHQASKSLDGLGMLVEQAAAAFFIWRGIQPETFHVISALHHVT